MTTPDPVARVQALAEQARLRREAAVAHRLAVWDRIQAEHPELAADLQALSQRFGQPAATRITIEGQLVWPPAELTLSAFAARVKDV